MPLCLHASDKVIPTPPANMLAAVHACHNSLKAAEKRLSSSSSNALLNLDLGKLSSPGGLAGPGPLPQMSHCAGWAVLKGPAGTSESLCTPHGRPASRLLHHHGLGSVQWCRSFQQAYSIEPSSGYYFASSSWQIMGVLPTPFCSSVSTNSGMLRSFWLIAAVERRILVRLQGSHRAVVDEKQLVFLVFVQDGLHV